MCVIIIKPVGAKMPTKKELKKAFIRNPHGCGFCVPGRGYKTLNFEDFYQHLKEVKKEEPCIIHFRYATHGSVCEGNCHPFYGDGVWFAHNGVLRIAVKSDKTDSETAFRGILLPTINEYGIDSPELVDDIYRIIGCSKFAFLKDGKIYTFGRFILRNGLYYSNLNHIC